MTLPDGKDKVCLLPYQAYVTPHCHTTVPGSVSGPLRWLYLLAEHERRDGAGKTADEGEEDGGDDGGLGIGGEHLHGGLHLYDLHTHT